MKTATLAILSGMILLGASLQAQAENQWSKYQGVDSKKYQHKPSYPQNPYPRSNYPTHDYPQNSAPYSNNLQHHRPYPQPFARPYPSLTNTLRVIIGSMATPIQPELRGQMRF